MKNPICPTHKVKMSYHPGATKEQRWCGDWYNCIVYGCNCSTLIPSEELLELYRKAGKLTADTA